MKENLSDITFKINGIEITKSVKPSLLLIDLIRDELDLSGTKPGCLEGECGACTVIMNGDAVPSCLVLAAGVEGKDIVTIEGLMEEGKLHTLQEAFVRYHASQCGFCTPGMILTAKAYLDKHPNPSEAEVRDIMMGNLCRCTGYEKIIEAIMAVVNGEVR